MAAAALFKTVSGAPIPPSLPVGVHDFHRQRFIDYQLQRLYSEGYVPLEEIREAATAIGSMAEHSQVFARMSDRAEAEGRLRSAAFHARAAEFFVPPTSPERRIAYDRFVERFDRAFADEGLTRTLVPYRDGHLPVLRVPAHGVPKATLLAFGGFDSLIEEFYGVWATLAHEGFEVLAFDGPGQGGARAVHGVTFEHDWERPVAAILDHFDLEDAALVGMSMGGYWALRAAAYEPRISRVVAWAPVYDWLVQVPAFVRPMIRWMVRRRSFMRWSIGLRMRLAPILRHVAAQTLYVQGSDDLADVPDWFLGMNAEHLGSERITQDVLLMAGADDSFQPPKLAHAQAAALTAARSVTTRIFTAEEHASRHCQMGNLGLAASVLEQWLSSPAKADLGTRA